MDLLTLIQRLRQTPHEFLEEVSPIHLNSLFHGYGAIDNRILEIMQTFDYPLSSPPWPLGPCVSISVCSRVYLVEPDLARGVALLLEKFEEVLRTWPDKEPAEGGFAGRGFVEVVAEFVKQGRPGLLCGREQTPSWLFHFSAGFNLAFEELDARAAKAERDQIARFSHWLQREYSWNVSVPWHRLLHVYEGGGLGALEAFVCLWERFIVSPKEVARQAVP